MLKATLAASAQPRRATGSDPLVSQCEAAVPPYCAPGSSGSCASLLPSSALGRMAHAGENGRARERAGARRVGGRKRSEREGGREGEREGERKRGRKAGSKDEREGEWEGAREGGREGM